jgi:hypothetical protein
MITSITKFRKWINEKIIETLTTYNLEQFKDYLYSVFDKNQANFSMIPIPGIDKKLDLYVTWDFDVNWLYKLADVCKMWVIVLF